MGSAPGEQTTVITIARVPAESRSVTTLRAMDGSKIQPSLLWVRRNKRSGLWPAVAVPESVVPRFAAAPSETRRLVLFLGDHTFARVPESAISADAGSAQEASEPAAQDAVWEANHILSGAALDLSASSHDLWIRLGESRSLTFSRAPGGNAIVVKRANVRGANAGDTLLQLADASFQGSDDVQEAILALRSAPSPVAVRLHRQLPGADASGDGAVAAVEDGGQVEYVDQRTLLGQPELECTGCSARARPHTLRPEHRTKVHGTWLCGDCMVGRKVKVFWPVDGNWYIAEVLAYEATTGMHHLRYADGDEEPMSISCEQVVITAEELAAMGHRRRGAAGTQGQRKQGHGEGAAGGAGGAASAAEQAQPRSRRGAALAAPGQWMQEEEEDSDLEFAVEEAEEGNEAPGTATRKRGRSQRARGTRRRGGRGRGGAAGEEEGSEGDSGDQRCPVPGFEEEEIHSILATRQVLVRESRGQRSIHAVDTQYLVRWEGRPLRDSVWVSLAFLGSDTTGKRKLGQYRKTLRGDVQSAEDRLESADGFPIEPELLFPDRVLALRTPATDAGADASSAQSGAGGGVPDLVARGAFSDFVASAEGQALLGAPDAFRAVCSKASALSGREYFVKWCTLPYNQALWVDAAALWEEASVRTFYTRMLSAAGERPTLLDSAAPCVLAERELQQEGGDVAALRRALDAGQRAMLTHVYDEDRFRVGSCVVHTQLRHAPGRLIILVCQLATLPGWRDELEAWGTAEVVSYHGSAKDREVIHEREFDWPRDGGRARARFDVMLLTPEMLAIELDFVRGLDHSLVVIDEAQRLKTATSRAARTMGTLVEGGPALYLLAGGARASPTEALTLLRLVDPETRATLEDMDTGARTAASGPLIQRHCAARTLAPASERGSDMRSFGGPGPSSSSAPSPRKLTLALFEVGDAQLEVMRDVLACHAAGMKVDGENARLALTQRVLFRMREILLAPHAALSAWTQRHSPMQGGKPERVAAAAAATSKQYKRVLVMSQSAASVHEITTLLVGRECAAAQLTRATAGDERLRTLAAFRSGECAVLVQSSRVVGAAYELEDGDALIFADCGWGYDSRLPGLLRSTPPGVAIHIVVARNTLEGELVRRLLCSLRPHSELDDERVAPLYFQEPLVDANDLALQWALNFLTASGSEPAAQAAASSASPAAWEMRHLEVALDRPFPEQEAVREALFLEANPPEAAGVLTGMEESYSRLAATLMSGEASMRRAAVERLALAAGHGALHGEAPGLAVTWRSMAGRAAPERGGGLGFAGTLELAVARDPAPQDPFRVVQAPVARVREAVEAKQHQEGARGTAAAASKAGMGRMVGEGEGWGLEDGAAGMAGGSAGRLASSASEGGPGSRADGARRRNGSSKRRRVGAGRSSPRDGMPPPRQNVRRYVQHTEDLVTTWDQLQQLVCQAVCFGKVIQQRQVPSPHWLQGAVALTERRMVERAGSFHEDIRATLPLKPASPTDAYEDVDVAVASATVDVGLTLGANGYAYVNHVLLPSALPTQVGVSMQGFRLGDVLLTVNGEALVGLSLRSIMGTVSESATPRIFRVRRFQDVNFYRSERAFAGKPGSRPMIQSLSTAPLRRALVPLRRGGGGGRGGVSGGMGGATASAGIPSAVTSSAAFATAPTTHGLGVGGTLDPSMAAGPGAGTGGGGWGAAGEHGGQKAEGQGEGGAEGMDDMLGCNCTKSKCLQRHCSCFKVGRPCTEACRCIGCENCEGKRKYLRCARCGTTKTPVWRRGPQGQMLCNACGLLERRRGNVRRSRGKVQRRSTTDFVEMDEGEVAQLEMMEGQAGGVDALAPAFAEVPAGGVAWDAAAPAVAAVQSAEGVVEAHPAVAAPSGGVGALHTEAGPAQ